MFLIITGFNMFGRQAHIYIKYIKYIKYVYIYIYIHAVAEIFYAEMFTIMPQSQHPVQQIGADGSLQLIQVVVGDISLL